MYVKQTTRFVKGNPCLWACRIRPLISKARRREISLRPVSDLHLTKTTQPPDEQLQNSLSFNL